MSGANMRNFKDIPEGRDLQEYVKSSVVYDEVSGSMVWNKDRPLSHFKTEKIYNIWKAICLGKIAGGLSSSGYYRCKLDGKNYLCHRLAFVYLTGFWPIGQVDHISGDRSNNSWSNLRDVSRSVNQRNQKKYSNNTTGVTGVYFIKSNGRRPWLVKGSNKVDGVFKTFIIGYYKTKEQAVEARLNWLSEQEGCTVRHGR